MLVAMSMIDLMGPAAVCMQAMCASNVCKQTVLSQAWLVMAKVFCTIVYGVGDLIACACAPAFDSVRRPSQ